MSRAIRLTRIHAINWYGYRDSIAIDGNLLLAGVTGSGKSILMDLIQFVLVGDLRMVKFNQSATGAHSDRSLKGYCLGDTKQEEAGVTQYMRDSAIAYVALEFTWPSGRRAETWGFRIEFVSAAESQGRVTPFFVPAALGRADFLDAERRPLDFTAFKALVESRVDRNEVRGRIYATVDEYTRDLQQPTHLNFNYRILRGLLPTAMSFTFLRSFNDFCRQFILSAERLDVRDVTESYRTFRRYEQDLRDLNDQFQRLNVIATCHAAHEDATRDAAVARYLEAALRHEHATDTRSEIAAKLESLRAACHEEDQRLAELEKLIPARTADLDQLKNTIRESPGGPLYLELQARLAKVVAEINRLTEAGRSLESALAARVRVAREWLKQLRAVPMEIDADVVESVATAITNVERGGSAEFTASWVGLLGAARRAAAHVSDRAAPELTELARLRTDLGKLRDEIAALGVGKLPFPTRLLDTLNAELPARGGRLPARHLRALCEIRDAEEIWRPAIEVAFTRKFAVVVSETDYDNAERIYHGMRGEARGESLVNSRKAIALKRTVKPGSLAEKLVTSDPVASAVIAHQFGDVMCVDRREELRDHEFAITPDGFMARGAFVERSRHYDNHPFIGERGLQQQLAWKEKQRDELAVREARLAPLDDEVRGIQQEWKRRFEQAESLEEELIAARRLPELVAERSDVITRLNTIDRSTFDELSQRQSNLEAELRNLQSELRRLDQSEKRTESRRLAAELERAVAAESDQRDRFERVRADSDVSRFARRIDEIRTETETRFPRKDAAANACRERAGEAGVVAAEERQKLIAARRELAIMHPRFDDLPADAHDNAAYERQLEKLRASDIPDYTEKAERERQTWERLFRTQVLEKLRHALTDVENTRVLLNNSLRRPIGKNRYRVVKWENPDFALYHKLLSASAVAREDDLFFASADGDLREACDQFLHALIDEDRKAIADRLLDYRCYFEYDMEVDDLGDDGEVHATARVDRQSGKFSGGENQSPYFIAILASYLRAYNRHHSRNKNPSLALVPIDEAFSKLSGERIKDCIEAMKALDLQGVFSMSTGNIPYAFEHCDSLVVVAKEERRVGQRTQIRNVPVSLHKDSAEAAELLGLNRA